VELGPLRRWVLTRPSAAAVFGMSRAAPRSQLPRSSCSGCVISRLSLLPVLSSAVARGSAGLLSFPAVALGTAGFAPVPSAVALGTARVAPSLSRPAQLDCCLFYFYTTPRLCSAPLDPRLIFHSRRRALHGWSGAFCFLSLSRPAQLDSFPFPLLRPAQLGPRVPLPLSRPARLGGRFVFPLSRSALTRLCSIFFRSFGAALSLAC
jgi:hypothetical protein